MVTLRQKVFFASRPLGRGDDTPRRESPEGPPNAAAINRAGAGAGCVVPRGSSAAAGTEGVCVCGVRAGGAAASLHRLAAALLGLVRRELRAGLGGAEVRAGATAAGRDSRDDDETRSEMVSVGVRVVKGAQEWEWVLAGALAC